MKLFFVTLLLGLAISQMHGFSVTERELAIRASKDEAAKNSILMYDKDEIEGVETLITEVKKLCQCEIDHLSTIQGLILHYKNASHLPASDFLSIKGIVLTDEDEAVAPPHDEIDEDSNIDEERLLLPETERMTTNDPGFRMQWALGNNAGDINWQDGIKKYMSDSQGASSNGPKVIVAVLDTGVDYYHPDLRNEMWMNPNEIANNGIDDDGNGIVDDVYGANFAGGLRGDPMDSEGHGTHCAGIIAATANNGQGVAGVAGVSKGKVKIMAIRILGPQSTVSNIITGLNYAIANGAKISSHSYGCADGPCQNGRQINQIYERILRQNPDHLLISAAGNEAKATRLHTVTINHSPAGVKASNSITVASSTRNAGRSDFSNTGARYVHVFAPGSEIWSTYPRSKGSYKKAGGTSMACPMVSGLAALVRSMRGNLNGREVKQLIEQNVQKKSQFSRLVSIGGLIDVDKTIGAITDDGGSSDCNDNNQNCNYWANLGFCRGGYEQWMGKNCQKSCNLCGSGGNCNDENQNCNIWANSGYCKGVYEQWMGQNCQKSCSLC